MKRSAPVLAAFVAASLLSACDSESEDPAVEKVSAPFCRDHVEVLSGIDAVIEGTDLRALVARVSTKLEGKWKRLAPGGNSAMVKVEVQPSVDKEDGSVEIRYGSGQVRLIRKEYVPCPPGAGCIDMAPRCVDQIEVDFDLAVRSSSGAFAETLVATVSIPDSRDPDSHEAGEPVGPSFEGSDRAGITVESIVDPANFQGSASITASATDPSLDLSAHRLQFACSFDKDKLPRALISSFVQLKLGAGPLPLYELEVAPK